MRPFERTGWKLRRPPHFAPSSEFGRDKLPKQPAQSPARPRNDLESRNQLAPSLACAANSLLQWVSNVRSAGRPGPQRVDSITMRHYYPVTCSSGTAGVPAVQLFAQQFS